MPPFGPISREDLIAALRQLGFEGPARGRSHQVMYRGRLKVRIPNPHGGDISRGLLARVLQQVGISREEWEAL